MSLKNLSVGERLGVGFGLIGLLFAMVVWQYHYTLFGVIKRFDTLQATQAAQKTHFLNVHRYMLEARRSEKDFLSRKKLHYTERVEKYVKLLDTETKMIQEIEKRTGGRAVGDQIHKLIQIYHSDFKKIVSAWKINGLDHNSGLQGQNSLPHRFCDDTCLKIIRYSVPGNTVSVSLSSLHRYLIAASELQLAI